MADPLGLAFDALAEDYDLGRPPWPPELLDGIDGVAALDLAAGTGKLTSLLVDRFEDVYAVEPLAGMRTVLARNVPSAHVLPGGAERIPLDDASVDAAFVAEAFHWFDSKAAVNELARVLRAGGTVTVSFNDWLGFEPALPQELRAVLAAAWEGLPPPGGPKVQSGEWKLGFADSVFAPLEEMHHRHEWRTSRDSIAAYFVSTSSMGSLPPGDRAALRSRIIELLEPVDYRLELDAHAFRTLRA
ncbi:MAG TPA: class I SAM-dependent methyltransferase [Gaiellaceae bacterium]|nr:class I SAM-dependent methyltransferase [Gaiellaceae bacterium]